MAATLDQMQQELYGLRQQVTNFEINVVPNLSTQLARAYDTIENNQKEATMGLVKNLEDVKIAIDAFATTQNLRWDNAHEQLAQRFTDYEVIFKDSQTKFDILQALIRESGGGSFEDFGRQFVHHGQQVNQLSHNADMLKAEIDQAKDMLKHGMGLVNDRITEEVKQQHKFREDLDLITKDTNGDVKAALNKIADYKTSYVKKNIMEHRAITNLDKLTGDKRQYNLWLEKFKSAFDQVDEGMVRSVLTILENNMDMLKPKHEGNWNEEVANKLAELNITTDEMDLVKKRLYAVLIDKVNGDMIIDIKNTPRDGLLSFLTMHRWFMETSGQGLAAKRTYVMHPPQAKTENDIYEAVRKWERELEDLMKLKGNADPIMDDTLKITALKDICCGKIKDVIDLRESQTSDFNEIRNEVMTYAMKKKAESYKPTTQDGASLNNLLARVQQKFSQGQSNYYPSWGYEQSQIDNWSLNPMGGGMDVPTPATPDVNSEDEMVNQLMALMGKGGKGPKGGGKGKGKFNGNCHNCGGYGHSARYCKKPKGEGKGYSPKGSYGGKDGGKGKGKGPGCWTCGDLTHYAKGCPKGKGKGGMNWLGDANQGGEVQAQTGLPALQNGAMFNLGGGKTNNISGYWQGGEFCLLEEENKEATQPLCTICEHDHSWTDVVKGKKKKTDSTPMPVVKEEELNVIDLNGMWERVTMTADTGAVNHVVMPTVAPHVKLQDTPASLAGASFTGAEGSKMPNLGQKDVTGVTAEGLSVEMSWQVAGKLRRNLAAIGKICSKGSGNRAVFEDDSGYIENKVTKAVIPMTKVGNLYEFDIWLPRTGKTPPKDVIVTGKAANAFAVLNQNGEADIEDFDTESGFTRLLDAM